MSFRSVAAKNAVLRMVGGMTAATVLVTVCLTNESLVRAQPPRSLAPPEVSLPEGMGSRRLATAPTCRGHRVRF
jgi:hypothetical protein